MADTEIPTDLEERVLKRLFDNLLNWERPQIVMTAGPYNSEAYDDFDRLRLALIDTAKSELRTLNSQEIFEYFSGDGRKRDSCNITWIDDITSEVRYLKRREPSVFAGGFGHPDLAADFEYWGKMPRFELDEAVALTCGLDPNTFGSKQIDDWEKSAKRNRQVDAIDFLLKDENSFEDSFLTGFGPTTVSVVELKKQIDRIELDADRRFLVEIEKYLSKKSQCTPSQIQPELEQRERETLFKLVAAMACEQYAYDPKVERNPTYSAIRDDLESVGLSMDIKTIRKWLKEAIEFVDKDYWSNRE